MPRTREIMGRQLSSSYYEGNFSSTVKSSVAVSRYIENGQFYISNRPVRIRMAGWESDTQMLQRNGWEVSVEEHQDPSRFRHQMRVALHHPKLKLYCVTNSMDMEFRDSDIMGQTYTCLEVQTIACEILSVNVPIDFSTFTPVDAETMQCEARESKHIREFKIFRPLEKEKEIIIPKESVSELLAKIHSMQEPDQEILREGKRAAMRKLNRDVNDYQLGTNIVAQIATLV
jgi:hypothetical protein